MIRGFSSVAWVAAVGGAALGCYILSLQVATERADLAKVEARIIATKQQIRSLQTELGTRGRLSQLEQWNTDVLALSAPASGQFLADEFTLARLATREPTVEDKAPVRMASMDTEDTGAAAPIQDPKVVRAAQAPAPAPVQPAIVHRASFTAPDPAAAAPADPKAARRSDPKPGAEPAAAARREKPRAESAAADTPRTTNRPAAAPAAGRTAAAAPKTGKPTEVARADPIPAPSATAVARPDRRRSDAGRAETPRTAGARSAPSRTDASPAKSGAGGAGTR